MVDTPPPPNPPIVATKPQLPRTIQNGTPMVYKPGATARHDLAPAQPPADQGTQSAG